MSILIIKLGALGDVVMATPLIKAIQETHDGNDVHLLTAEPFAPIFSACQALRVTSRPRQGILNSARTLAWIRRLGCTRIYDLQSNDRTGLMCALSGAPMRVGNHPRFPYTHHPSTAWVGQCHIFERMIEVLGAAGIRGVEHSAYLPVDDTDRAKVAAWLESQGLSDRNFVVLHASASAARPEKVWPYFESLGRRLTALGLTPIWIGSAEDKPENRRLSAAAGGIDASGAFTIPGLAELGRHARFAVTNDSGPMHVLAAAEIPVFGLFGPSDWRRNHAVGQSERVIACVELIDEFLGMKTAHGLDRISVEMVWARLAEANLV